MGLRQGRELRSTRNGVEGFVGDVGEAAPILHRKSEHPQGQQGGHRSDQIIDYEHTRAAPIYSYIFAHYHTVEMVGDISVMLPN